MELSLKAVAMNIQDRAYAAAIFIVLGICCIGAYVAVSGFMNATPQGLTLGLNSGTQPPTLESAVEIPTGTVAPPTTTSMPTEPPTKTPKGFVPSPTTINRPPTLDLPTVPVTEVVSATPSGTAQVGCGYPFCGRIGAPEAQMAPTGRDCPTDYLWGVVYDRNGKGISNWEIRYQQIGVVSDHTVTKGPPDTRIGGYDIPAGSGTWILQLYDSSGNVKSPPFQIKARQTFAGGSTCPSRVDFIEQ
jgi:hypothetical protein